MNTTYPKSLSHYEKLLRDLLQTETPTIFEVGCHDGSDSLVLLNIFPDAELHCFEPEPRAIKSWKESVLSMRPNCFLHETAVSDRTGEATFFQSSGRAGTHAGRDWDLSGSLCKPTGHLEFSPWVKFRTKITVPTTTLDDFCSRYDLERTIDLLWMDVQGAERKVIEGARETLLRVRYLYTEYGHWRKPLYEGQMTLEETKRCLGGEWKLLATFEGYNALFERKERRQYEQSELEG